MPFVSLLTICLSVIISLSAIAAIFVNGWVKASHITELKDQTNKEIALLTKYAEEQFKCHREELNKLWEKISSIDVVASKLEDVKEGVDRLERMLVSSIEKRNYKREV